ncbi:helix-turn-helix transcriptional regulator [Yoonia sp. SDW83-1]|uniref:helix-turn-helix transcriptional regulator n=1 Tax=Yoonia sp. SDW83-1 TaxID=3366945 RepID=UPI00398C2FC7
MEKEDQILNNFIGHVTAAKHIDDCWEKLTDCLRIFGFTKLLFAAKANVTFENLHNHFGVILLSTYGAEIDEFFFNNRAYVTDMMTRWALENQGAISWQVNRNRFLNDAMTKIERQVHLMTRELGLIAGYTYSPSAVDADFVSGFGLSVDASTDQEEVDRIWSSHGPTIERLLDVFHIAVRRMPIASEDDRLPSQTLSIARLISEGKTNSEVAEILNIHRRTVEQRLSHARYRLDVANTSQLVAKLVAQAQLL